MSMRNNNELNIDTDKYSRLYDDGVYSVITQQSSLSNQKLLLRLTMQDHKLIYIRNYTHKAYLCCYESIDNDDGGKEVIELTDNSIKFFKKRVSFISLVIKPSEEDNFYDMTMEIEFPSHRDPLSSISQKASSKKNKEKKTVKSEKDKKTSQKESFEFLKQASYLKTEKEESFFEKEAALSEEKAGLSQYENRKNREKNHHKIKENDQDNDKDNNDISTRSTNKKIKNHENQGDDHRGCHKRQDDQDDHDEHEYRDELEDSNHNIAFSNVSNHPPSSTVSQDFLNNKRRILDQAMSNEERKCSDKSGFSYNRSHNHPDNSKAFKNEKEKEIHNKILDTVDTSILKLHEETSHNNLHNQPPLIPEKASNNSSSLNEHDEAVINTDKNIIHNILSFIFSYKRMKNKAEKEAREAQTVEKAKTDITKTTKTAKTAKNSETPQKTTEKIHKTDTTDTTNNNYKEKLLEKSLSKISKSKSMATRTTIVSNTDVLKENDKKYALRLKEHDKEHDKIHKIINKKHSNDDYKSNSKNHQTKPTKTTKNKENKEKTVKKPGIKITSSDGLARENRRLLRRRRLSISVNTTTTKNNQKEKLRTPQKEKEKHDKKDKKTPDEKKSHVLITNKNKAEPSYHSKRTDRQISWLDLAKEIDKIQHKEVRQHNRLSSSKKNNKQEKHEKISLKDRHHSKDNKDSKDNKHNKDKDHHHSKDTNLSKHLKVKVKNYKEEYYHPTLEKEDSNISNIVNKPKQPLPENDKPKNSNECPVCLEKMKNRSVLEPCEHAFCNECISNWAESSTFCPICKHAFKKINNKKATVSFRKIKKFKYDDHDSEEENWYNNLLSYCMVCKGVEEDYNMLVCEKCNVNVCHYYCDGLKFLPNLEENWECKTCRKKEEEKERKNNISKHSNKKTKKLPLKRLRKSSRLKQRKK